MADASNSKSQEIRALMGPGVAGLIEAGPAALAKQNAASESGIAPTMSASDMAYADRFAALLEAAFLVAAADGELSAVEGEQLAAAMIDLTEGQIPDEEIEALIDAFLEALHEEGFEARIKSVAQSLDSPELRRAAFALAAGIACVDGKILAEEVEIFEALAKAFEIPTGEIDSILKQVADQLTA
jgi:uncharacterized tellurite resistance protein B-like protein